MPVIDIDGEKKKVACGPCIRGHRSSKCQHSDRVLIEVRKPGRPLSACPHPTGSCGCQRAVYYTVPKHEAAITPSGPLSPLAASFGSHMQQSSNRVQKSKPRKNSTSVNPSFLQRVLDDHPDVMQSQPQQSFEPNLPNGASDSSNSNVPSLASSTSSTPQTEALDTGQRATAQLPALPEHGASRGSVPLQLGMLGVGGYGTVSDNLGWDGDWPDYSDIPPPQSNTPTISKKSSCCGNKASNEQQKPVATKSCCSSTASDEGRQTSLNATKHVPGQSNSSASMNYTLNPTFANELVSPPSEINDYSTSGLIFTEDQFGCNHQPDQSCLCGEGCECLGCALHPANRTTTDYVRYHTELAMRDWVDPLRATFASDVAYVNSFTGAEILQPDMGFAGSATEQPQSIAGFVPTSASFLPPWYSNSNSLATPTFELSQFTFQNSTPLANTTALVQAAQPRTVLPSDIHATTHARQLSAHDSKNFDHDSPSTEDDASTLSPSAFSVQQYNIPGCNDTTGTCLCGDGCQCEGCVTHNGHQRNVLDSRPDHAALSIAPLETVADVNSNGKIFDHVEDLHQAIPTFGA